MVKKTVKTTTMTNLMRAADLLENPLTAKLNALSGGTLLHTPSRPERVPAMTQPMTPEERRFLMLGGARDLLPVDASDLGEWREEREPSKWMDTPLLNHEDA